MRLYFEEEIGIGVFNIIGKRYFRDSRSILGYDLREWEKLKDNYDLNIWLFIIYSCFF